MAVAFLFSLAVGILSGLGVGSGGLLILFLVEWAGASQREAQGLNLAFFVLSLGAALLVHLRRRPPNPTLLAVVVLFGVVGALVGGKPCHRTQSRRASLSARTFPPVFGRTCSFA